MNGDPFDRFGQYDVTKDANGNVLVKPPAALSASQAPPPGGAVERVAQVVINVPLGKLPKFLALVQELLTDDEWRGPYPAP